MNTDFYKVTIKYKKNKYQFLYLLKNNKIIKKFFSNNLIIDWFDYLNYIKNKGIIQTLIDTKIFQFIEYSQYEFKFLINNSYLTNVMLSTKSCYRVITHKNMNNFNDFSSYIIQETRKLKLQEIEI